MSTETYIGADGWFTEEQAISPGQKLSLKVEEVLYDERSEIQDILVFASQSHGNVLVLDGVVQITEKDEFTFQEMIAHLPLFSHPDPKKVLIVGGGDGGVLREVSKHPNVETIHLCEIDPQVCEVAKKFFAETIGHAFDDPRLVMIHEDAAEFVKADGHELYDVIIVDSSDPVGPAASLFDPSFFEALRDALNPNGIICSQGECIWLHLDLITSVIKACCELFPIVEYACCSTPTYPCGEIGFFLLSLQESEVDEEILRIPLRHPPEEMQETLKYYDPLVHSASFVLPHFAQNAIDAAKEEVEDEEEEEEEEVVGGEGEGEGGGEKEEGGETGQAEATQEGQSGAASDR